MTGLVTTPAGSVYPAHWEADVLLSDGGTAHIRPIRPDDADRLRVFWSRLSSQTLYYRFFTPHVTLSDSDVERFTVVDQMTRGALVAIIGEDMVAVARWERRPGQTVAEVAFVVEDAHQGRGIGSVLLEHLASAARERGVRRFEAEVLAQNRQMLGVFFDAGYGIQREFESGTISLEFDIADTEQSVEVMRAREHRAEARSIARLLRPRTVAVVGASRTPGAVGNVVLRHLLAGGFDGPVYPVNPATVAVASVRAYPSVLDVPDDVDLAVVCTPPVAVPEVVEQCGRKGTRGVVVLTELGSGQADRSLVVAARARGMRIVGPASLGIVDIATGLNASLAARLPPAGRVGCYSQSGPLGFALLSAAAERGLGMSSFVSAGNRADVSGNDLLQYWEDDPATDVVLMYLETFGNPRKFARLARRVGRTTPVVVVKSGRSALDDALLRQAGVIRVDRVSQGFDVTALLVSQPLPRGRRVAVVGDAHALVGLAARACEATGLIPEPVMLDAGSSPENYEGAFLRAAEGRDAVVSAVVPPFSSDWRALAAAVSAAAARSGTPVVATVLGSEPVPAELAPVPAYPSPEGAVAALAHVVAYAEWRAIPPGTVPLMPVDREEARAAVRAPGSLDPSDAARLLAAYGIPVEPAVPVRSPDEAVEVAERLGWPAALKARAPEYRHRPEMGAVRVDLAGAAELRTAWAAMTTRLGDGPYVVQAMAPPGVPVVVGSVEDPTYGPLVSFGLAGVATDLLGDCACHILPLTDADAARLVRAVRAAPLLFGHRGAQPVDVPALEQLLLRVARLADDLPEVASLQLNPVVVAASGVHVLSAEVTVGAARVRADAGPRRLRQPAWRSTS